MHYDTQVIYGDTNKATFSWNGWTYYRTKTGLPKRQSVDTKKIETVVESDFVSLKENDLT